MSDEAGDEAGPEELDALEAERPRRRGDCVDGLRPCPWVSCRYHLAHDRIRRLSVDDAVGALETMDETCALDLADRGEQEWLTMGVPMGLAKPTVIIAAWVGMARIRETRPIDEWDEPAERIDPTDHTYSSAPARHVRRLSVDDAVAGPQQDCDSARAQKIGWTSD